MLANFDVSGWKIEKETYSKEFLEKINEIGFTKKYDFVLKLKDKNRDDIFRVIYLLLIFLISWFVFRSRLNDTIKVTFLTMPLMVILIMIGISLYQQPKWIMTGIGALIICVVILYLHKREFS